MTNKSVPSQERLTKKSIVFPISSFGKEEYPEGEVVGEHIKVTTDFLVELGEKYYFCSFRIQIKNVPGP